MRVDKPLDTMTAKRGWLRLSDRFITTLMKVVLRYWKWRIGEDMVLVCAPYKDVYAQHLQIASELAAKPRKVELPN